MQTPRFFERVPRAALRIALSYSVTSGLSVGLGMLLIAGSVLWFLGAFAAGAALVGIAVVIPPDQPAPRRGKLRQLLPAVLMGMPLFFSIQALHASPLYQGLLLVPATFGAFLAAAWGKHGVPLSVSIMFSMIFSMAVPAQDGLEAAWSASMYFLLGAGLYLSCATLANALLNPLYRVQMLADTLLKLATLMRMQAQQLSPSTTGNGGAPLIGEMLRQQADLADQLQTARDILLESPRTASRQRLAGMLLQVLELRDYLLACDLDLDTLKSRPGHEPMLVALREVLESLAEQIEQLADALLTRRQPALFESYRPRLAGLQWTGEVSTPDDTTPAMLARGMANRVGHMDDECLRLMALARGEVEPDLSVLRATWQMFVSPTTWSRQPFARLWRRDAPPLRHAIRAALAIATGFAISQALPWSAHVYWILLTIVVVLRGSFAQTVKRRNQRVLGTLLGCLLAGSLLSANAPPLLLMATVILSQCVAHAFAIRRYLIASVAGTVLGLVQAHLLNVGSSPVFDVSERLADTFIGITIAWAFSYVLPSWERGQIPRLVARTLAAQVRHARIALGLGQLQAIDNAPELEWRLARREAYDSLSALVHATQQSLSEPRAVRPPLAPLGRLLAHSYQLLAQLTVVKTNLLLRRERLRLEQIRPALLETGVAIESALTTGSGTSLANVTPVPLPDPFESDLSPWVLYRLKLAADIALQLREDADQVLHSPT